MEASNENDKIKVELIYPKSEEAKGLFASTLKYWVIIAGIGAAAFAVFQLIRDCSRDRKADLREQKADARQKAADAFETAKQQNAEKLETAKFVMDNAARLLTIGYSTGDQSGLHALSIVFERLCPTNTPADVIELLTQANKVSTNRDSFEQNFFSATNQLVEIARQLDICRSNGSLTLLSNNIIGSFIASTRSNLLAMAPFVSKTTSALDEENLDTSTLPPPANQGQTLNWDTLVTNSWVKPNNAIGRIYFLPIAETDLFFWPIEIDQVQKQVKFTITSSTAGRYASLVTKGTIAVGGNFLFSTTNNTANHTNLYRVWLNGIHKAGYLPSTAAFITVEQEKTR